MRVLILMTVALFLSGCSVFGGGYTGPSEDLKKQWAEENKRAADKEAVAHEGATIEELKAVYGRPDAVENRGNIVHLFYDGINPTHFYFTKGKLTDWHLDKELANARIERRRQDERRAQDIELEKERNRRESTAAALQNYGNKNRIDCQSTKYGNTTYTNCN